MVQVVVVLDQLLREEDLLLSKVLAAASPSEEEGVEGGGEGEQVLPGELAGRLLLPLVDAQHLVLGDNVNDEWDDCNSGPEWQYQYQLIALDSPARGIVVQLLSNLGQYCGHLQGEIFTEDASVRDQ